MVGECVRAVGVGEHADLEAPHVHDQGLRRVLRGGEGSGVRQADLVQRRDRPGNSRRTAVEAVVVRGEDEVDAGGLRGLRELVRRAEGVSFVREVLVVRRDRRLQVGEDVIRLGEQSLHTGEDFREVIFPVARRIGLQHRPLAHHVAQERDLDGPLRLRRAAKRHTACNQQETFHFFFTYHFFILQSYQPTYGTNMIRNSDGFQRGSATAPPDASRTPTAKRKLDETMISNLWGV